MQNSDIIIYQNEEGNIKIDVRLEEETVWLTQAQIALLFGKGRTTVTEHILSIFKEGELDEKVVCRNFRLTTPHGAIEGKTQEKSVKHYNLDVIISVGYRVKSIQGTHFRIWATQRLKEYIIKGFTLNDDRFKSGTSMNGRAIFSICRNNGTATSANVYDRLDSTLRQHFKAEWPRITVPCR